MIRASTHHPTRTPNATIVSNRYPRPSAVYPPPASNDGTGVPGLLIPDHHAAIRNRQLRSQADKGINISCGAMAILFRKSPSDRISTTHDRKFLDCGCGCAAKAIRLHTFLSAQAPWLQSLTQRSTISSRQHQTRLMLRITYHADNRSRLTADFTCKSGK